MTAQLPLVDTANGDVTRWSSASTCEELSNQRVRSACILVNLMVVVRHRLRFHVANHVNHRGEA